MNRELPHLEFLPIHRLIIHEWHDNQRTPPLIRRIRESGVWRNPPVVSPLPGGDGRYMVLDGANRFTAAQAMGLPDILVQVVASDNPGLQLQNWNHVVWELSPDEFRRRIEHIPDTLLTPAGLEVEPDLWGSCGLALIQFPGGEVVSLCTDLSELEPRVEMLNALVDSYKSRGHLDRTNERNVRQLHGYYPNLCGLVIFPHFDIDDVMCLAAAGCLLPSGITRFTIAPRALHLNYPLSELEAERPLEEKNAALQAWFQSRIAAKSVRYYDEPTVLFDE